MAKAVVEKASPEIKEMVQKGELRLGMARKIIKKSKAEQQAELDRLVKERKEKQEAAREKREVAKNTGKTTAPKEHEANQRMIELDAFKKKWQSFNEMQQRSFVEDYRDDLQTILQKIAEHEAYRHAAE